jgi:hypothetical protein
VVDREGAGLTFVGYYSKYYSGVIEEKHRITNLHDESIVCSEIKLTDENTDIIFSP